MQRYNYNWIYILSLFWLGMTVGVGVLSLWVPEVRGLATSLSLIFVGFVLWEIADRPSGE